MYRLTAMALCFASALAAQTPVSNALRFATAGSAKNLIGSAEEMPADKYAFKPTPAQMSFADVVVHLVEGNDVMCGWVSGTTAPAAAKVVATDPKDKLVARLKQSFDFCTSAFAKLDDSKLADSVPFFGGRKMTQAALMFIVATDWADHYSQAAIYLRLNGLLPPTAKRKEG
jgi:uncharacterized damage-inducible protein DinB